MRQQVHEYALQTCDWFHCDFNYEQVRLAGVMASRRLAQLLGGICPGSTRRRELLSSRCRHCHIGKSTLEVAGQYLTTNRLHSVLITRGGPTDTSILKDSVSSLN
jgi:hypothetical protein